MRRDLLVAGLRLEWLGSEALTWLDLRDFAANSPRESALFQAVNPDWCSPEAHLLREVEYHVRWLVWAQTKDGEKGLNHPERIRLPDDDAGDALEAAGVPRPDRLSLDELRKQIPMERG